MEDGEQFADTAEQIEAAGEVFDVMGDVLDKGNSIARLIGKVLPKHRQCTVQIDNQCSSYILRNPKLYTDTGLCAQPLPLTIKPDSSGEGLFTKGPYALRGSGGVITYDLYNPHKQDYEGRMAVLYKVPYDLNLRSVVFAIGLMDIDTECDEKLFKNMYKQNSNMFVRGNAGASSLTFEKKSVVTIGANMSNSGQAIMKIEVLLHYYGEVAISRSSK